MANKDLELALRIKADLEQGQRELKKLEDSIESVGNQTEQTNAKLGKQRAAISAHAAAAKAAGISVGQYQQAMRQLPAQITDITTSLASGMPIWLVAIQQGGQIRDSFGSWRASGRGLLSTLKPLTLAVGATAAVAAIAATAYFQGSQEASEYAKALILTGNVAGTTADALAGMASRIDDVSGTQRQAAAALAEITNTGKFTADQIERIGAVAVLMENNVGRAVGDTVAEFVKLANEPAKAAAELNDKYHFLTLSVYDQIAALERQGDTTAAAELAIKAYADTMQQRSEAVEENLGSLERGWKAVKSAAAETWDAMLGIGRADSLDQRLQEAREQLAELEASPQNYDFYGRKKSDKVDVARRNVEQLEAQKAEQDAAAKREAERQRAQDAAVAAQREIDKLRDQSLTKVEKKEKEIAEYRRNIEKVRAANPGAVSDEQIAKDIANIEAKYKEAAPKKDPRESTYASLNKQITERIAALQAANDAESKLTDTQKFSQQLQASLADGTTKLTAAQRENIQERLKQLELADRENQAMADARQLQTVQAQLLAAQGNSAAAVTAQLEQQYGELLKRLADRGDQAGTDLVKKLINVEQAKAQLTDLQAEMDRVFAEQARQEGSIQAQQQAGVISEISARKQIIDLHAQTAVEIEKLLPLMEELAIASGDPAAIERVKQFKARVAELKLEVSDLTLAWKRGFEDGIAGALQGLAQGTMNLRDAATSFVQSIAGSLSQLASQKLAEGMFDSILENAPQVIQSILGVQAAKTAADQGMTASAAVAATENAAIQTTAAAETAAAWTPAATAASIGSWGAAAAIGLAAVVAALAFKAFAEGGHVRGPGTTTSDSIPAWLSDQEFVTRAAVVTQPGALPFLEDFNRRGMSALADWSSVVRHATGGLAGVPAPAMPAPSRGPAQLAEPAASTSATLKNSQNFFLVDDPSRVADAAFNSRAGEEAFIVMLSRDPGKFRSILNING